jgi:soluble lytic murein transglycosylase-like protein
VKEFYGGCFLVFFSFLSLRGKVSKKNFLTGSFFGIRFGLRVFLILFILGFVTSAYAEPERYDSPAPPQSKPVKLASPSSPQEGKPALEAANLSTPSSSAPSSSVSNFPASGHPAAKEDARKVNEAKRKSIAALLRRYNKKLDDKKAYDYAILIIRTSEKFGQDPFLITSIVVTESSAKPGAISKGGDYGLMQVRWKVHHKKIKSKYPRIAKAKDILDPKDNLLVGTEIFSTYRATASKDVRKALMYYSAGNERMTEKVLALASQLENAYHEYLKNS